jgi:transcriptional antiterminator NusG
MIFAVRTTSGQEKSVAELMASKVALKKLQVSSILAPEVVKGYIFVESAGPHFVDDLISGVKHARARTKGIIAPEAVERFIVTKSTIDEMAISDTVEVISGPFRGLRARITGIDRVKEEVIIELLEEGFATLPITVHADYVKVVEKGGKEVGREESR